MPRYTAVDDYGVLVNPMVATGQAHGAMAQGMNMTKLPEREKGGVSVVSEPVEFGKEKRLGWS